MINLKPIISTITVKRVFIVVCPQTPLQPASMSTHETHVLI